MSPEDLDHYAAAVEAVVTAAGILAAGLWTYLLFVRNRQKLPRASVAHSSSSFRLADGRVLLMVRVEVQNTGNVLIKLASGFVRLRGVVTSDGRPCTALEGYVLPSNRAQEYAWPDVGTIKLLQEHEIEPGESDAYCFEFLLPPELATIQIYSHLQNTQKRKHKVGWNCTSLHTISSERQGDASSAIPSRSASGTSANSTTSAPSAANP